jgi:hypothetical protein
MTTAQVFHNTDPDEYIVKIPSGLPPCNDENEHILFKLQINDDKVKVYANPENVLVAPEQFIAHKQANTASKELNEWYDLSIVTSGGGGKKKRGNNRRSRYLRNKRRNTRKSPNRQR